MVRCDMVVYVVANPMHYSTWQTAAEAIRALQETEARTGLRGQVEMVTVSGNHKNRQVIYPRHKEVVT